MMDVDRTRGPPPPLLALNPMRLKREASRSGEMPPAKRLHMREYEEIVDGVLERMQDQIYICSDARPAVYTRTFSGRNSRNRRDDAMSFRIEAKLAGVRIPHGQPSLFDRARATARRFELEFTMADSHGPMRIRALMERGGVEARQDVACGLRPLVLREQLVRVVHPWLDFAHARFGAHNLV
jgi:hypothetical protein